MLKEYKSIEDLKNDISFYGWGEIYLKDENSEDGEIEVDLLDFRKLVSGFFNEEIRKFLNKEYTEGMREGIWDIPSDWIRIAKSNWDDRYFLYVNLKKLDFYGVTLTKGTNTMYSIEKIRFN